MSEFDHWTVTQQLDTGRPLGFREPLPLLLWGLRNFLKLTDSVVGVLSSRVRVEKMAGASELTVFPEFFSLKFRLLKVSGAWAYI